MKDDIEKVEDTVRTYVEGVVNFEFEKGESAWHPDGLKIGIDTENHSLTRSTISETRPDLSPDQIEDMKQRVSQKGTIVASKVSGHIAHVELLWHYKRDREEIEITDFILLQKIMGDWKIVAKVHDARTKR